MNKFVLGGVEMSNFISQTPIARLQPSLYNKAMAMPGSGGVSKVRWTGDKNKFERLAGKKSGQKLFHVKVGQGLSAF